MLCFCRKQVSELTVAKELAVLGCNKQVHEANAKTKLIEQDVQTQAKKVSTPDRICFLLRIGETSHLFSSVLRSPWFNSNTICIRPKESPRL